MWVNSKTAANILNVKYDALQKATRRAEKLGKNFCLVKFNILNFTYIDGRGGASGKILQIWLDDALCEAYFANAGANSAEFGGSERVNLPACSAEFGGADVSAGELNPSGAVNSSTTDNFARYRAKFGAKFGDADAKTAANSSKNLTERTANERNRALEPLGGGDCGGGDHLGVYSGHDFGRGGLNAGVNSAEFDRARVKTSVNSGANLAEFDAPNLPAIALCSDKKRKEAFEKYEIIKAWQRAKGKLEAAAFIDYTNAHGAYSLKISANKLYDWQRKFRRGGLNALIDERASNKPMKLGELGLERLCEQLILACKGKIDIINIYKMLNYHYIINGGNLAEFRTNSGINSDKCGEFAGENSSSQTDEFDGAGGKAGEFDRADGAGSQVEFGGAGGSDGVNSSSSADEFSGSDTTDDARNSRVNSGKFGGLNAKTSVNSPVNSSRTRLNLDDFQARRGEIVSYDVVYRFVKAYLNRHKLVKNIILYGEDGAVGRGLPAIGKSNWAVGTINEVVEIDASPLDLICNAKEICDKLGFERFNNIFESRAEFENYVSAWQKRYTIIALIDTYSGVASFHISESENSLGIARAVAKYITRYGKPQLIKGDNGKAFKSEFMRSVLGALEIEYKAVRAYSGWLKPYVERNFRALQHSFSANLAGFIGHNMMQRQAIEFFRSKKERRLKRGEKTNLSRLKSLIEVQNLMDLYAEKFLNSRYLERLGKTCTQAFNEKIADAKYMDALSLSARLSKRELKHVTKKGIHVDGVWFYSVAMFEFERVFVNKNINNINECFIWSEAGDFIGVASTLDLDKGQSAEEARASQKLFTKRLKDTKKQMEAAAIAHQGAFEQIVAKANAKQALLPKPNSAGDESKLISAALSEAKNLSSNSPLDENITRKPAKKIKGWDEIVCG